MEKIYDFLKKNKWIVWVFLLVTTIGFGYEAVNCKLEENIFKLLPKSDNEMTNFAFTDMRLKDKIFVQVVRKDTNEPLVQEEEEHSFFMKNSSDSLHMPKAMDHLVSNILQLRDKMFHHHADSSAVVIAEEYAEENEDESVIDEIYMSEAMDYFMSLVLEKDSDLNGVYNTLAEVDPLLLLDAANYLVEHGPAYLDLTEAEMDSLTSEKHIEQQIGLYMELLETNLGSNLYDVVAYDPCGFSMAKIPASASVVSAAEEGSATSRFQNNHLFAGDNEACIGFITPTFGPENSSKAYKLIKRMNEAKAEMEREYPGVEVMYHGTIVLAAYNSRQIKQDIALTLGIALIVIIIFLSICFKRPSYIFSMLLPIVFGVLFSLGIISMKGGMSLLALGLGVIVLGVALSYCLHMLVHYVYTGEIRQTIREQSKPIFYGAMTTIAAFVGLLLTTSALLKDFGLFALLVVIGTTFISLFILPHFFPKKSTPNKKAFRFLEKVNAYKIDHNWFICAVVWIFVVVCICFSGKYEFDSNLYHIGYVTPATKHAQANWNRLMNDGNTQQYYASIAPTLEEALEQLPAIEARVDSLREAGIILNKMEVSHMMPSLAQQEERNERWLNYFTPQKQNEVWERIRKACRKNQVEEEMFEPFLESMSVVAEPEYVAETGIIPEEILGNFLEVQASKDTASNQTGTILVYFPVKTDAEHVKEVKDILTQEKGCLVLDPYYYSTNLVELIHSDFNLIMLFSSIFVFILLWISNLTRIIVRYSKNKRINKENSKLTVGKFIGAFIIEPNVIALISFAPMILSWYTVLGAMAIFHQPFNVINIVVSSFIFGIGVDYSIFIMDGLLRGKEDNKAMVFHKTAITLSAFVLVVCMFSLVFATHPAINSIGFVSLVGMITTMMLSYTLQPNLYRLYMAVKKQTKKRLNK